MGEMEERGEDGDVGNGDTGIEVVTGHNLDGDTCIEVVTGHNLDGDTGIEVVT